MFKKQSPTSEGVLSVARIRSPAGSEKGLRLTCGRMVPPAALQPPTRIILVEVMDKMYVSRVCGVEVVAAEHISK